MGKSTNSQIHYFDALNNQPLNDAAKLGFEQALTHAWSEPSRLYSSSRKSRQLLEEARNSIAQKLHLKPSEVFFGPGFPFIFSHLVRGLMRGESCQDKKILISNIEQSALLSSARNFSQVILEVKNEALVDSTEFDSKLTPDIGLAILQFANHEVGTKQPIEEIYKSCKANRIPLLVDATMTFEISQLKDNFDILVLNPVSWQGPAGLSVVAIRDEVEFITTLKRDKRENRKFPAFPHVPLAISTAAALEETSQKLITNKRVIQDLQKRLIDEISTISGARVLTNSTNSLINIISAIFEDIDGETLVHELDKNGYEISSGSSCVADEIAPSHVMQAIGEAGGTNIRVSLPVDLDEAAALGFINSLNLVIKKIRSESSPVTY